MPKDIPTVPIRCNDCIDTGLVRFESYPTNNNPCEKKYNFVKPCTCSASQQWIETIERVVSFNKANRLKHA